mmetsp:Transcript_24282/g.59945  ORF Transcript_24282/g.59945 Transcript_24282/m.59945 type:complete len:246 (-) Transcript_24282:715-1452(-)
MQVQPATVRRAIDLLASGVDGGRHQVPPRRTLVERDRRPNHVLALRPSVRPSPPVYLCLGGLILFLFVAGVLLLLAALIGQLPRIVGVVFEVGNINAIKTANPVEFAFPRPVADVVCEGQAVPQTSGIRHINIAGAGALGLVPVVGVYHDDARRSVQDGVGTLLKLERHRSLVECLGAVVADHHLDRLLLNVVHHSDEYVSVRDEKLVAAVDQPVHGLAKVLRVGEMHVMGPSGELGLVSVFVSP